MKTRKCSACELEFPETEKYFYRRYGREGKFGSYCRTCFCKIQRKQHADLKQRLLDYKGKECVVCGYDEQNHNLTFHHMDPSQKEIKIAESIKAFEKLKKEVDKCVVMCHHCHNDTHAGLHPEYLIKK